MPDDIFAAARREGRLKETGVNMAVLNAAPSVRATLPGMELAEPGTEFEAELPLSPSINHYWRHRIAGSKDNQFIAVYISGEGETFKEAVSLAVKQSRQKQLTGPLAITLIVCPKDARSIDVDNRIKPCLDALAAAGLVFNDSQFEDVRAILGPIARPDGKMLVRIVPRVPA